jgi:hypothetical protein
LGAANPSTRQRFLFSNPDADPAGFVVADELNFHFLKRSLAK